MSRKAALQLRGLTAALAVLCTISLIAQEAQKGQAAGPWQEVGGGEILLIEEDILWLHDGAKLRGLGIERRNTEAWAVRREGLLESWTVGIEGGRLRILKPGQALAFYTRLDVVPQQLTRTPPVFGEALPVPPERLQAVQKEIAERFQRDQDAARKRPGASSIEEVIADNNRYIKALIEELGWIDRERFGDKAAANALILVHHSGDLPLLEAALPYAEKDWKDGTGASQLFSVFYDRVQIFLGRKQRYGTQIGKDAQGRQVVLPLEDLENVEKIRKALGLSPLTEYLDLVYQTFKDEGPIRMPRADE